MSPPTDLLPPLAEPDGDADLVARLRSLGTVAVAPSVAERHLGSMRRQAATRSRRRRAVVAGVAAGAVLLGSTSLAAAGVLPAPAQSAAHQTLGRLGIVVPEQHRTAADATGAASDPSPARRPHGGGLGGATGIEARRGADGDRAPGGRPAGAEAAPVRSTARGTGTRPVTPGGATAAVRPRSTTRPSDASPPPRATTPPRAGAGPGSGGATAPVGDQPDGTVGAPTASGGSPPPSTSPDPTAATPPRRSPPAALGAGPGDAAPAPPTGAAVG